MPSTRATASMAKSEPGATIENPIDLSCNLELLSQKGTRSKSFLALILNLTDGKTDDPIVLEDATPSANLLQLVELLKLSQKIVVISGSGISENAGCKILSSSCSFQILIIFSSRFPMFTRAD